MLYLLYTTCFKAICLEVLFSELTELQCEVS